MGQDLASVAFHDQTSAALSAKICILFMATARPCTCAHTLMHPIQMILTLHTALTATVVLLCLRNGIFDAQVTNRRGRVELQRQWLLATPICSNAWLTSAVWNWYMESIAPGGHHSLYTWMEQCFTVVLRRTSRAHVHL